MKVSLSSISCGAVLALAACDSQPDAASPATDPAAARDSSSPASAAGAEDSAEGEPTKSMVRETTGKSGMKTTASGLKYEILKSGDGKVNPKATDTVTVHYHGTLLDGTVFDSSVDRGQPASFPLNQVIAGWTEGVQLMKQGDKFKFEIPPDLAYGARSPSPAIPPNSTLVFEVELLEIK